MLISNSWPIPFSGVSTATHDDTESVLSSATGIDSECGGSWKHMERYEHKCGQLVEPEAAGSKTYDESVGLECPKYESWQCGTADYIVRSTPEQQSITDKQQRIRFVKLGNTVSGTAATDLRRDPLFLRKPL